MATFKKGTMGRNILTVDVEDNFTYEELVDKKDWQRYESQVVENTLKILDILETYKTTATFFVVGKVAERHPDLIREIDKKKHRIASHSYSHNPVYRMDENDFRKDLKESVNLLTKITNKQVFGYRAMGYSVRKENIDWVLRNLNEYGIKYDSSIDPLTITGFNRKPCYMERFKLYEFPLSVYKFGGMQIPFAGGTYLRLLPYKLIKNFIEILDKSEQTVVIYIHPWEFNKNQPERNVPLKQKILQHPITFNTEKKLVKLLKTFKFCSIEDYLSEKTIHENCIHSP